MSGAEQSDRWFYKVDNVKRGPISANDLRDKIITQEVTVESPVWRDGMDSWVPARQVGALFPDGFVPICTGQADSPPPRLPWKRLALYGCAGIAFLGLLGAQLFVSPPHVKYGSIRGYVKAVSGEPAGGVVVEFVDDGAGLGVAVQTDSRGFFYGEGIKKGTFRVAVRPPAIDVTHAPLMPDAIAASRASLESKVPMKFHSAATSGIIAELEQGRNQFDIDLSKR